MLWRTGLSPRLCSQKPLPGCQSLRAAPSTLGCDRGGSAVGMAASGHRHIEPRQQISVRHGRYRIGVPSASQLSARKWVSGARLLGLLRDTLPPPESGTGRRVAAAGFGYRQEVPRDLSGRERLGAVHGHDALRACAQSGPAHRQGRATGRCLDTHQGYCNASCNSAIAQPRQPGSRHAQSSSRLRAVAVTWPNSDSLQQARPLQRCGAPLPQKVGKIKRNHA